MKEGHNIEWGHMGDGWGDDIGPGIGQGPWEHVGWEIGTVMQ